MKKKKWNKGLIASLVCAFMMGAALFPAMGAGWIESIQVRSGISLNVNGENVVPTDASGKEMPVFLYDATTYVPVRYLSEQYGKEVDWDPETATVYINDPAKLEPAPEPNDPDESYSDLNDLSNLVLMGKEESRNNVYFWQNPITHEGKELEKALAFYQPGASITFKLDRKYSSVHFDVAFLNNGFNYWSSLKVETAKVYQTGGRYTSSGPSKDIYQSDPARSFDFDVADKDLLTISTLPQSYSQANIYKAPCVLLLYNAKLTPIAGSTESEPAA